MIWDPAPVWDGTIEDALPHKIELTITRLEDGSSAIDVSIDGVIPSRGVWFAQDLPVLSFNQVAFGASPAYGHPGYSGLDYIIDDVKIEYFPNRPPCEDFVGDVDLDDDVDMDDFAQFQRCLTPTVDPLPEECECFDFDKDLDVDLVDHDAFVLCGSGAGVAPDPDCLTPPQP
jgi:hypothetical protein